MLLSQATQPRLTVTDKSLAAIVRQSGTIIALLVPLLFSTAARGVSSQEQTLVAQPSISQSASITAVNDVGTPFPEFSPVVLVPNFPTFNSQRLDQQIRIYAHYLATSGPPDVLIVGSSRSLQGIDPEVLQQALAARGLSNLRIYNFGVNGATAQVVDLLLRRVLTPNQLPRLIIWADGSRAFNSARIDLTYNGILASEGYKRLATGDRPIRYIPLPAIELEQEICVVPPAAMNYAAAYSAYVNAQHQAEPLNHALEMPSLTPTVGAEDTHLLPLAGSQPNPFGLASSCTSLSYLLQPPPYQTPAEPILPIPPLRSSHPPIAADLSGSGFQSVPAEFNPATYYRQFPRVSGRYDSNYTPFRLEGEQTTAAIAVAQFARSQRIPLIFVSLPLTQEYLDPVRTAHEQQFRQYMQRLAAREGFLFRDLMHQWPTQNHYFADPSHLNRNGARAVAQYLATDTTIPWVQPHSIPARGR
ncbi:MAG: hypothetical protein SFY66_08315 [Oculatellaceae cyanobacterium bins.114]|nr:hypothetical protein [Oculatellaceae cyanobacterium bins.114]